MIKYLPFSEPAMLVYLILMTLDKEKYKKKPQQNKVLTCTKASNVGLSNIVDFGQVKTRNIDNERYYRYKKKDIG